MPYTEAYYIEQTHSGLSYQRNASSKPDISRLIHGYSDFWISPSFTKERKKKSIVIGPNWSAKNWDIEAIEAITNAVAQLIDDGFDVYLWQNSEIKKLSRKELSALFYLTETINALLFSTYGTQYLNPILLKQVQAATVTQHRIPVDEIHVLDYFRLKHLLNQDSEPDSHYLSLHDFSLLDEQEKKQLLGWLSKSEPEFKVLDDEQSSKAQSTMAFLHSHASPRKIQPMGPYQLQYGTI